MFNKSFGTPFGGGTGGFGTTSTFGQSKCLKRVKDMKDSLEWLKW
jgi:hypothetical protein